MTENSAQIRKSTPEEDIRELYRRTAKLNDAVSALLAPEWGSAAGIIPADHPLYVDAKPAAEQQEQGAPVGWQAIVRARERELKQVGEARHQAEQQVRRLGLMVDEYAAGAGHLTDKIKRVRDVCDQLRRASVLADGEPHTDRERGVIQAITRVLAALDQPAAHDTRPTIAECAADEAKHWNDRQWEADADA